MANLVKKLLSKEDLASLSNTIGEAEKITAGEIRISIREKRRKAEKSLSLEDIARKEFQALGMTKTADRTGVLLFLLAQEKQFYILADQGIHSKVDQSTWNTIASEMSSHFTKKEFRRGLSYGVQEIGKILSLHFPRKSNDTNELPNDVRIGR